jgi:hypothetical protein
MPLGPVWYQIWTFGGETVGIHHGTAKGHCIKIVGQIAGKDLGIFTFRENSLKRKKGGGGETWKDENIKRILQ